MVQKICKIVACVCALSCIGIGGFYLIWWYISSGVSAEGIGISYPGTYCFILIGLGLLLVHSKWTFPYPICIGAFLCTLTLVQIIHRWFFPLPFWDRYPFFISHANPFNLMGFILIGTVFLFWKRNKPAEFVYLYDFFVGILCIGLSMIGISAHILGLGDAYGNTHLSGLITLSVASIGIISTLVYYENIYRVRLQRWVPFWIFATFFVFDIVLQGALRFNRQFSYLITDYLIAYTFWGGIAFSAVASLLAYFWLRERVHLQQAITSERKLESLQEEKKRALQAAEVGIWQLDTVTYKMHVDSGLYRLFAFPPDGFKGTFENLLDLIHPDDRDSVRSDLELAMREIKPFDVEHRVIWPDQSVHYLHAKGNVVFDAHGLPTMMTGIVWDVTERKRSEKLLKLSEGISKILTRALSIQDASEQMLVLLKTLYGWEILSIWKRQSSDLPFQCITVQTNLTSPAPEFIAATKSSQINMSNPFLQQVFQSLMPVFSSDVRCVSGFIRAPLANKEGIISGLFIPILAKTQVVGVIELYMKKTFSDRIDASFFNILNMLGVAIGEFIQKLETEKIALQHQRMINAWQDPIYSCSLDGKILTWNPAAEKVFRWTKSEAIGRSLKDLFPAELYEECDRIKESFQNGLDTIRIQSRRVTKDGNIRWMDETYSLVRSDTLGLTEVAILAKDITEERKSLQALSKSEEKFRSYVESSDQWIWEMDLKGHFTYTNHAIERILGYSKDEVLGQFIHSFVPEMYKQSMEEEIRSQSKFERGWQRKLFVFRNKSGKERILEGTALVIYDEQNRGIGLRGALQDVTEREMIEKNKNTFISMISHEIRTPLTCIHGALGLLSAQKDLSKFAYELVDLAYRNSDLLTHLIRDIVDVEKMSIGKLEYHVEPVFLSQLIHDVIVSTRIVVGRSGMKIIEEPMIGEILINVDVERLKQVLWNLLSNAIKFSPPDGSIFVSMEIVDGKIRVNVRDEGTGIPEEFQPKIFGRFEQAQNLTKEQKGSGLGLNIAKTIVEHMGGNIGFISKPNQGALFYFEFPYIQKATA